MTPDLESTLRYPILDDIEVPEVLIENWQITADLLAEIAGAPAALIMRVHAHDIEVFVSSHSPGNVYHHGERAPLNAGLYCETVLGTRRRLLVPDARKDPDWDHNPDLELGMISYSGLPIAWPNGELFGTICILDGKEAAYPRRIHHLMERFRDSIQLSLASIHASNRSQLQRDEAESALHERETDFRLMVEGVQDYAIVMLDPAGRVLRWNAGAERINGYRPEEIVGRHFSLFYLPEDIESGKPERELKVAAAEGRFEDEGWRVRKDGSRFFASVVVTALRHESGQLLGFGKITRDITESKKAEEDLRANRALLREILESVPQAIFRKDKASVYLGCNQQFARAAGLTDTAQVVGKTDFDLPWSREQAVAYRSEDAQVVGSGMATHHIVEQLPSADGTWTWVETTKIPLFDIHGQVEGILGVFEDITERRQAENALRESEENYRLLIESTFEAIVVIQDGLIEQFNPAGTTMTGYSADELVATPFPLFVHPDDRAEIVDNYQRRMRGEPLPAVREFRLLTKDGSTCWVLANSVVPFQWNGRPASLHTLVDITERKDAESALRESERRFRDLLQDVPGVPVQGYRMDGTTTYWNKASEALYGYTKEEAMGRSLLDLVIPPEAREGVREAMRQMAETGQPIPASELSLRRKDGSSLAVFSSHAVVQVPGRAAEMFCLDVDMTDRQRAEAALRESELKFRSLFETAEGAILLLADGRFVDCNARALSIFGCTREQIIGGPPSRFSPPMQPDGQPSEEEAIRKINLAFTAGPQVFEWEHCRADGTPFAAEVSLNWLELQGKPQAQAIVRDITDRRRAEAALRESEDRFRGVVEGAAMPIFVSLEMKFTYLNPSALRLFGATTPEQVLGQPILSRIHPDCHESIRKRAVRVFQGQRGVAPPQEEVYLKLDGTPVPVEATASPITYQGQPAAVVFVQDISERRRMEEAHALLAAQFLQAQKLDAVGQLAAGIAHDFNNLLAAILGNAQLAVEDTESGHPARVSLEEIQRAGNRAKDLVQQILTYSRQQVQDRRVLSLEPVVTEAARFLRATIPSGVEIVLALAAHVPPVLANATQIQQVILNLCTNAWHALDDRPGRIEIQLQAVTLDAAAAGRLTGLRPGLFACLSVRDTGKGMDAALIERIFDPFFTTKEPGKGTGLGLSVVHGVVVGHDGAITVASQPGQGATFQVYFPAAAGIADSGIASAKSAPQGQGQHVLFLDDEEALVFLATRMLERLGYRVTGFTQAAAAVQAFRANPGQFDVVITDLNMPGASGLVVARELLTVRPDLRVLLCSGHVTEQLKEQAHGEGIRHVLYKPNTMEEFGGVLHQLISEP